MESRLNALGAKIRAAAEGRTRLLVAVAGPPGAGKSTLAEALADKIGPEAQVIPMDGFHRDNEWLIQHDLLARKGAPDTFDAAAFLSLIKQFAKGESPRFPLFDRAGDCTVPEAGALSEATRILLIEGNYLLLDRPIWRDLAAFWDMTVFIDVPKAELERRLIARWIDHGLDPDAARARAQSNDLINADTVIAQSAPADWTISNG
ncbi:AAA domain-containing protein [Celeribacter baekdonensis]|uniref:AAA domain-containing protein n=1 Tax=Celeribacter baekdonensis TaxID=875171 RepID=A0A1G7H1K1_9RHOB|nr:AAA family ATPase [Celeribacter baekdonensis]SDE94225.1 AAA domain-containing protein [Celeribacter baekdonensis]